MTQLFVSEFERRLNTVALALKDKYELDVIVLYFKGNSPSVIGRWLGSKTWEIRAIISKYKNKVSADFLLSKRDELYKLPLAFELITYGTYKCVYCGKSVNREDRLRHLKYKHKDVLELIVNDLLKS